MLAVRVVRWMRGVYGLALLAAYCCAFVAAFACVFFFPIGALGLVILSVLSTALVPLGSDTLGWLDRALCRHMLGRGTCPGCGMPTSPAAQAPCASCGSSWADSGERLAAVSASE